MRNKYLSLAIFMTTLLAIAFLVLRPNPEVASDNPQEQKPPRKVYVGAWVGGSWDSATKTLNTEAVKDFQKLIDKKLAIVNIYSEWTYLENPELIENLKSISAEGWTPMISSNPFFFEGCPKGRDSLYETIANGDCDDFLKSVATNFKSYEKPILFRFAWEMNLPNMYWSIEKVGSKPEDFIGAWRRFHKILRDVGANNTIWILSFNTSHGGTTPYKELYPGDNYVDWVAIDGYNWGSGHDFGGWASFDGTFKNSYNELTKITDKPVMLSEVNSSPDGGDKAAWLTDMLSVQIPEKYPNVNALIFFNENKTEGESVDWRLEKSPNYTKAVSEGLKNEIYKSLFP